MSGVLVRALVLRWIARHRLRSGLAVVAVALGVAAFLASAAVSRSVLATAASATSRFAGGADLVVTGEDAGLPAETFAAVRSVPDAAAAAPLVAGWVRVVGGTGRRLLLVGVDPLAEAAMPRGAGARAGATVTDPAAFVLGAGALVARPVADEWGLARGATIEVQGVRGARTFTVAGTFDPPGGAAGPAARTAIVALAAARGVLGSADRLDRVDVAVAAGADAATVAAAIRARLGATASTGIRVEPPGESDPTTRDLLGIVDVSLKLGALVALLVGMFLVHHTVAIGVAEREREVGILRALGATRRQVVLVFCAEALALGVTGAALGAGLGLLVARTSLDAFASTISGAYFPAEAAPIEMPLATIAAGVAAGALVALAAALRPAWRAASVAPSDAIRRGPEDVSPARTRTALRAAAAVALTVVAAAACVGTPFPRAGWVAAFVLLAAFLVAAPLLLVAGARVAAPLLRRVAGVSGRLAAQELARHPRRAALPAATLAIGLALVVETMGNAESLSQSMSAWLEENVAGDLFVSSGTSALSAAHTILDASLGAEIAAVPGVRRVTPVRTLRVAWRGTRILLVGLDLEPYRGMVRLTVRGAGGVADEHERDAILARAQTGDACLVSDNFAVLHGTRVGDEVVLPAPAGEVRLRVAGLFPDYSWPRGTVIVERRVLVAAYRDERADQFSVQVAQGADAAIVARDVEDRVGPGRELVVSTSASFRATARRLIDDFFALAYAQVAAALAVAFLAVLNSLWIAVVMRRRELALFRAVGATRRQLVAAVVLQAATMGVLGAAYGLAGGLAVQWIAVRRVIVEDTGWTPDVLVPWAAVATTLALGVATSALAGVVPARAAARSEVRDALGTE